MLLTFTVPLRDKPRPLPLLLFSLSHLSSEEGAAASSLLLSPPFLFFSLPFPLPFFSTTHWINYIHFFLHVVYPSLAHHGPRGTTCPTDLLRSLTQCLPPTWDPQWPRVVTSLCAILSKLLQYLSWDEDKLKFPTGKTCCYESYSF